MRDEQRYLSDVAHTNPYRHLPLSRLSRKLPKFYSCSLYIERLPAQEYSVQGPSVFATAPLKGLRMGGNLEGVEQGVN
jgi:hypothetical protein